VRAARGRPRAWCLIRQRAQASGPGAILLAGIVLGQAILYGPSLIGSKVLLPLDLLASPKTYLPLTPETLKIVPHDLAVVDLVLSVEPARRFSVGEYRAGRCPSWTPFQFGGSRFVFPAQSPFWILKSSIRSPVVLAWAQMALAVVVGLGTYLFCRRTLDVGFWPATVAAWCFPLTGFFVFWLGYPMTGSVAWLPWILLAVHSSVRRSDGSSALALAMTTALVLISGQLDVAGQVLLVSGLYAIHCLVDAHGHRWPKRRAVRSIVAVVAGWALGFLLAASYVLPLVDYTQTGSRMTRRGGGEEERPPIGLAALPQTVLPDMYGSTRLSSAPLFPEGQRNQLESSAAAYSGLLATLLVAPLAWCSRRHRSINIFWAILGFIALAWVLDVPGFVAVMRMPGLNMMSHNRLVFAASFAIVCLNAVGLEMLIRGDVRRRAWFCLPAATLIVLYGWCLYRGAVLPEPLASGVQRALEAGQVVPWIEDIDRLRRIQANFSRDYLVAGGLCGAGIAGWMILWFRSRAPRWLVLAIGAALLGDLLWFAYGRAAQCDPALYYPRIPVLEQISRAGAGRIMGFGVLPPTLSQTHDLNDVRGYDGVDPVRWIELLMLGSDPTSPRFSYALTQSLAPVIDVQPPGILRLHPVLDMLGVRYVVFRGAPPAGMRPDFSGDDYWALTNRNALPRVFVPARVESLADDEELLRRLGSREFDPRAVAFVESPISRIERCRGSAAILEETPSRIVVRAELETSGLVVLSDRWDDGWTARLDGRTVRILRVNHAIRGVEVPAGTATLEFRYEPSSRSWGLRSSGAALLLLIGWLWIDHRSGRRISTPLDA